MQTIDRSKPIMVTGATGYVAGWLIKRLLDKGLTVHAAVRDPSSQSKVQPLQNLADQSSGEIKFFKSDLLDVGSYDAAMQGCELVFHTASPFVLSVEDNQRDLVDPAVKGTRNVLESANRTPSVKRVVITSSVAAMYTDAKDIQQSPNNTLTEDTWNTTASLNYQPYSYSKTLAEKAAWEIADAQNQWGMVTINPSLVIGAAVSPTSTSESFTLFKNLGNGSMKAGAPAFSLSAVDVRDVADAHFAAGFNPEAKGRFITSTHETSLIEVAKILHDEFGDNYSIPTRKIPKWLLWLVAPMATKGQIQRKTVSRSVEISYRVDNSKSIKQLGLNYRPLKESLLDMFQYMIDNNYFK